MKIKNVIEAWSNMNSEPFNLQQLIRYVFNTFKNHWAVIAGATLSLLFAIMLAAFGLVLVLGLAVFQALRLNTPYTQESYNLYGYNLKLLLASLAVGLVMFVIFEGLIAGYQKMMLDLYDHGDTQYITLFSQLHRCLSFTIAKVLYYLVVSFGMIFFVFPGIYLGVIYSLYSFAMIDQNLGIIESFSKSKEIINGHKMLMFGLYSFFYLLYILSGFTYGILGIISLPLSTLSYSFAYRKLQGAYH
jgi:uncharacterized membrane protein